MACAGRPLRQRHVLPALPQPHRPSVEDYAGMCRWLVHATSWGTLSTMNTLRDGVTAYPEGCAAAAAEAKTLPPATT